MRMWLIRLGNVYHRYVCNTDCSRAAKLVLFTNFIALIPIDSDKKQQEMDWRYNVLEHKQLL